MSKTLSADALTRLVADVIAAAGSAEAEAQTVASNLVMANLSGHDSHGVGMVPRYIDAVLEGGLKPNTGARATVDIGTMLALDGQCGYGQVVGEQAMRMGIERARQHGSCIMTVGNSHHLGRIGHFAEMAVAQGLVSLHFVNVLSRPVVAPFGGGDGRFGTNPCCIGVPLQAQGRASDRAPDGEAVGAPAANAGTHGDLESPTPGGAHFVLDYATSRVAQGKMRVAHNKGERVPDGYLIDERGHPSNDPGVVVVPQSNGLFGALMTFGEHKGYGMAVACELLGGALSGGGTWHRDTDHKRSVYNGMLTVLIDPARLGTQASFEAEAQAFVDWLRQSPTAAGHERVQIAGEPERAARVARAREGIVLDDATWAEIVAAGTKVGASVAAHG